MDFSESYKYVGVIASFTAWLAIAVVLYKWPVIKSKSISKHVAAYKQAWLLFAPLETVALVLFFFFMFKWFIPALNLPTTYSIVVTMALLLELITTWIPDTHGIKHKIHHFTAYGAAWLLPILNLSIVFTPAASVVSRVAALVLFVAMVAIIYMFLRIKGTREKHLIYQGIYFACFHVPLLLVIFTT